MKDNQLKKLEFIKNQVLIPNITECANCGKRIDITTDFYKFGTSLNDDFIYCSDRCEAWHFSQLMF